MRVLFVSMAAPPKSGAESVQVARFLLSLQQRMDLTLVTAEAPASGWEQRFPEHELSLKDPRVILFSGSRFAPLLRLLPTKLTALPDSEFIFHLQSPMVKHRLTLDYDVIYSRSLPLSSAVLARKLSQALKLPWVMHLSDPWEETNNYNLETRLACFRDASRVFFTTTETAAFYQKHFPQFASKFLVMPNVHAGAPEAVSPPMFLNNKVVLAYIGNCYGGRSFLPIVQAIKHLAPEQQKHIQINIVGNLDIENERLLRRHSGTGFVVYGPQSESVATLMRDQADVLLSIDLIPNNETEFCYLPSKVQDAIAARKYLVTITSKGSASWNTLGENFGQCFTHDDITGLSVFLGNLVNAFVKRDAQFLKIPAHVPLEFHPDYQAKRLEAILGEVIQESQMRNSN